jgi:hypothetical protein
LLILEICSINLNGKNKDLDLLVMGITNYLAVSLNSNRLSCQGASQV